MSGNRSNSAESGLLEKAVDITGKICQKKNTGHNRIARYSASPWETKYQADPVASVKPPIPPTAKAMATMERENSSIFPRLLRKPFKNIRQRRWAMATNWAETCRDVISCGFNSCTSEDMSTGVTY